MNHDELRRKQVELARAMRDGRDDEAERLALELAPELEPVFDALDRDPKAITPAWNELA